MNERGHYGTSWVGQAQEPAPWQRPDYIPYKYREEHGATRKRRNEWERMTEAERWTARQNETAAERYTGLYDEQQASNREKRQAPAWAVVLGGGGFVALLMVLRKLGTKGAPRVAPRREISEPLPVARVVRS